MIILLISIGCTSPCPDWSRLDGFYTVNAEANLNEVQGQNVDAFLQSSFFLLGWSEWEIEYQPAQQSLDISIDDQQYVGLFSTEKSSCTEFSLSIDGIYLNESGEEQHNFIMEGDFGLGGIKWTGPFESDVDWRSGDGTEGTANNLTGELVATKQQ